MTAGLPPLMESKKVLAAARPSIGIGPPTSLVLRGLREVRTPPAVLVGFLLSALAPLGLVAAAVAIVLQMRGQDGVVVKLFMVAFAVLVLLLAALAWRGTKRTAYFGEYDGALFVPRLAVGFCVVALVAAGKLAFVDGEDPPASFVAPFLATAVLWLPALAFARPSAKGWADRVLLRRGLDVHREEDAHLLASTRPHSCGANPGLAPQRLVPVADDAGRGWASDGQCAACGRPRATLYRLVGADAYTDAGGGDRAWFLLQAGKLVPGRDGDVAGLPADELTRLRFLAASAARCAGELLAMVPPAGDVVPRRQRNGLILPVGAFAEVWSGAWLTSERASWQSLLGRVDAEQTARAGGSR